MLVRLSNLNLKGNLVKSDTQAVARHVENNLNGKILTPFLLLLKVALMSSLGNIQDRSLIPTLLHLPLTLTRPLSHFNTPSQVRRQLAGSLPLSLLLRNRLANLPNQL